MREGQEYLESSIRRGHSFFVSMIRWVGLNLLARKVVKETRMTKRVVSVSYSDLVSNPKDVLSKICNAAGLDYEKEILSFHRMMHHNIAGTQTRFNPRPIDNSSQIEKKLKFRYKVLYNLSGGKFWNRIFNS